MTAPDLNQTPVEYPYRKRAGTWASFEKRYEPIPQSTDPGGCKYFLFDSFSELPDWVQQNQGKDAHRFVWTIVCEGDGPMYLIPGWHFVNRMGYVVGSKPWGDTEEKCGQGYVY